MAEAECEEVYLEVSDAVTRGKNPISIIAWGPGNAIAIVAVL